MYDFCCKHFSVEVHGGTLFPPGGTRGTAQLDLAVPGGHCRAQEEDDDGQDGREKLRVDLARRWGGMWSKGDLQ